MTTLVVDAPHLGALVTACKRCGGPLTECDHDECAHCAFKRELAASDREVHERAMRRALLGVPSWRERERR